MQQGHERCSVIHVYAVHAVQASALRAATASGTITVSEER
jgi:hypothetical protein